MEPLARLIGIHMHNNGTTIHPCLRMNRALNMVSRSGNAPIRLKMSYLYTQGGDTKFAEARPLLKEMTVVKQLDSRTDLVEFAIPIPQRIDPGTVITGTVQLQLDDAAGQAIDFENAQTLITLP